MEMSSGGDLFDRVVKKKHYPEHEAKKVMTQILQAMAYLHEKNIAHRDIKPENILLVSKHSDVDIKLTDFGLAKKVDESGKMKTFCGTPQYFAPEVLQRRHTTKGSGTLQRERAEPADHRGAVLLRRAGVGPRVQ
jgi:serine/threonine protein kinase